MFRTIACSRLPPKSLQTLSFPSIHLSISQTRPGFFTSWEHCYDQQARYALVSGQPGIIPWADICFLFSPGPIYCSVKKLFYVGDLLSRQMARHDSAMCPADSIK